MHRTATLEFARNLQPRDTERTLQSSAFLVEEGLDRLSKLGNTRGTQTALLRVLQCLGISSMASCSVSRKCHYLCGIPRLVIVSSGRSQPSRGFITVTSVSFEHCFRLISC